MKRWAKPRDRKVSAFTVTMAKALLPETILRSGTVLDVGDSLRGYELGPTVAAFPILGFSGTITQLHAYDKGRFDAVAVLDKAEEFTWLELRTIAGQAHRVLKDGGHLILVWDAPWYHGLRNLWSKLRKQRCAKYARSKKEMAAALKGAGFLFGGCGTWALGAKHWAWVMKLEPRAGTV